MGCDTKGFIVTDNKDIWEVVAKIRKFLATRFSKKKSTYVNQIASVGADYRLSDFSKFITVNFRDSEDDRTLFVFFDCDSDYASVKSGPKIIFNLGCWGKSDELILGILAQFDGEKYYRYNDYDDKEWERV